MTRQLPHQARWERSLGIFTRLRPGEGPCVLMFFSYGFMIMLCYYVLKTLREPLLLVSATAETKSYAYAVIALLLLFIVPVYGVVFRQLAKRQISHWVTGFLLTNLLIFYLMGRANMDIGFAYYVWVGIFGVLITAQFWAFAADTFNVKTGQRIFPLIMAGVSLGGLAGPALVSASFEHLGPLQLMLITAVIMAATLPLVNWSRDAVPKASRSQYNAPEPSSNRMLGGFELVLRNNYLLMIAILVVLLNWVNSTGEYILTEVVLRYADSQVAANDTADKGQIIAGFYGNFFFTVNTLALFIQVFVVARLFRWIGVHGALLILPVIAFIGYGLMAFVPIFSMIRVVKILENSTDYSLMNTVRHSLFLPLTTTEKYESKIAIDTFFWRFGDLIQAGVIYIGLNWLNFEVGHFAMVNMALAVVWLLLAVQIGRHYILHRQMVTVEEPPRLVRPLEEQPAPAGVKFDFNLPTGTFIQSDPGDVLTISVRPVDGGALSPWLNFDKHTLHFYGTPPADIDEDTWLIVRATNFEGAWAEGRFRLRHH